jgi:hypothetical protein
MEDYLPILQLLHSSGVQFAAIGTWALKVYFPDKMADYVLHDCDVVLAPDLENVRRAIRVLRAAGWEVTSWDEPVFPDAAAAALNGRFYLRAFSGPLTLDLTYECLIDWDTMKQGITLQASVPLASVKDIFTLKLQQGTEKGDLAAYAAMQSRLHGLI